MNPPDQDWQPCPPGILRQLVQSASPTPRLIRPLVLGLMVGLVGSGLLSGIAMWQGANTKMLTCTEVMPHLNAYADGEVHGRLEGQIATHLRNCQRCRRAYEQMQTGLVHGHVRPHQTSWQSTLLASTNARPAKQ